MPIPPCRSPPILTRDDFLARAGWWSVLRIRLINVTSDPHRGAHRALVKLQDGTRSKSITSVLHRLQSGGRTRDEPSRFLDAPESLNPCAWMDCAFCPSSHSVYSLF